MHPSLPLTAFEEYMLRDDRPAHPMDFFIRLRFTGRLDRSAVAAAWHRALMRHPLLTVLVAQPGRGRPQWIERAAGSPVSWLASEPAVRPLDLRSEPGVRAWAVERAGTTDFWTQFHHAACDGLGAMAFLEDFLAGYATAVGAAMEELRPLRPDLLPYRNRFGLSPGKWLGMLHRQAVGLLGVWQFLRHKPVPLAPQSPEQISQPLPCAYPAMYAAEFSRRESQAIRESARRQGATLNDLLIRDLLMAMFDWREQHAGGRPDDWLRLAVPVNLRTAADAALPAANVVSMVFIDRRADDAHDPAELLRGIHGQMEQIKRLRLGLTFVLSLGVARVMPGGMAAQVDPSRCAATAVLTNCGESLRTAAFGRLRGRIVLGNSVLEAVDVLPPLRPHTSAALAVLTYGGRLRVTLHYDPRPISPGQARELFHAFFERIHESAAGAATMPRPHFETLTPVGQP